MGKKSRTTGLPPNTGISRDGTSLDSTSYVDGANIRFYKNRPKKSGGTYLLNPGTGDITRSILLTKYVQKGIVDGVTKIISDKQLILTSTGQLGGKLKVTADGEALYQALNAITSFTLDDYTIDHGYTHTNTSSIILTGGFVDVSTAAEVTLKVTLEDPKAITNNQFSIVSCGFYNNKYIENTQVQQVDPSQNSYEILLGQRFDLLCEIRLVATSTKIEGTTFSIPDFYYTQDPASDPPKTPIGFTINDPNIYYQGFVNGINRTPIDLVRVEGKSPNLCLYYGSVIGDTQRIALIGNQKSLNTPVLFAVTLTITAQASISMDVLVYPIVIAINGYQSDTSNNVTPIQTKININDFQQNGLDGKFTSKNDGTNNIWTNIFSTVVPLSFIDNIYVTFDVDTTESDLQKITMTVALQSYTASTVTPPVYTLNLPNLILSPSSSNPFHPSNAFEEHTDLLLAAAPDGQIFYGQSLNFEDNPLLVPMVNNNIRVGSVTSVNANNLVICENGIFVCGGYIIGLHDSGKVSWNTAQPLPVVSNPMKTNYCINYWNPSNYFILGADSMIYGAPVRSGNDPTGLIWTSNAVIQITFQNTANIDPSTIVSNYSDDPGIGSWQGSYVSTISTCISARSIVSYEPYFYWVGTNCFYTYNGGAVTEVPNEMNKLWFFEQLNFAARNKITSYIDMTYHEWIILFPRGDSEENNWALIYQIDNGTWYDTPKTAAFGYRSSDLCRYALTSSSIYDSSNPSTNYPIYLNDKGVDRNYGAATPLPIILPQTFTVSTSGKDSTSTKILTNPLVSTFDSSVLAFSIESGVSQTFTLDVVGKNYDAVVQDIGISYVIKNPGQIVTHITDSRYTSLTSITVKQTQIAITGILLDGDTALRGATITPTIVLYNPLPPLTDYDLSFIDSRFTAPKSANVKFDVTVIGKNGDNSVTYINPNLSLNQYQTKNNTIYDSTITNPADAFTNVSNITISNFLPNWTTENPTGDFSMNVNSFKFSVKNPGTEAVVIPYDGSSQTVTYDPIPIKFFQDFSDVTISGGAINFTCYFAFVPFAGTLTLTFLDNSSPKPQPVISSGPYNFSENGMSNQSVDFTFPIITTDNTPLDFGSIHNIEYSWDQTSFVQNSLNIVVTCNFSASDQSYEKIYTSSANFNLNASSFDYPGISYVQTSSALYGGCIAGLCNYPGSNEAYSIILGGNVQASASFSISDNPFYATNNNTTDAMLIIGIGYSLQVSNHYQPAAYTAQEWCIGYSLITSTTPLGDLTMTPYVKTATPGAYYTCYNGAGTYLSTNPSNSYLSYAQCYIPGYGSPTKYTIGDTYYYMAGDGLTNETSYTITITQIDDSSENLPDPCILNTQNIGAQTCIYFPDATTLDGGIAQASINFKITPPNGGWDDGVAFFVCLSVSAQGTQTQGHDPDLILAGANEQMGCMVYGPEQFKSVSATIQSFSPRESNPFEFGQQSSGIIIVFLYNGIYSGGLTNITANGTVGLNKMLTLPFTNPSNWGQSVPITVSSQGESILADLVSPDTIPVSFTFPSLDVGVNIGYSVGGTAVTPQPLLTPQNNVLAINLLANSKLTFQNASIISAFPTDDGLKFSDIVAIPVQAIISTNAEITSNNAVSRSYIYPIDSFFTFWMTGLNQDLSGNPITLNMIILDLVQSGDMTVEVSTLGYPRQSQLNPTAKYVFKDTDTFMTMKDSGTILQVTFRSKTLGGDFLMGKSIFELVQSSGAREEPS